MNKWMATLSLFLLLLGIAIAMNGSKKGREGNDDKIRRLWFGVLVEHVIDIR